MKNAAAIVCLLAFGMLEGACTTIDAVPVTRGSPIEGVRLPDVKPLLVVGSQVSVILVPNPNRGIALRFGTFLAKNELTINFQQGILQSMTSTQDSTPVPVAFLSALGQAAAAGKSLLGAAFAAQAQADMAGRLQIYDIEFDDAGNLIGLKPLIHDEDLIRVPTGITVNVPQAPSQPSLQPQNPAPVTPLPKGGTKSKSNPGS